MKMETRLQVEDEKKKMAGWWGTVRFWRRREREKCMGLPAERRKKWKIPPLFWVQGRKRKSKRARNRGSLPTALGTRRKWLQRLPPSFAKLGMRRNMGFFHYEEGHHVGGKQGKEDHGWG